MHTVVLELTMIGISYICEIIIHKLVLDMKYNSSAFKKNIIR